MAQDGTPRCTERHTHADFARALANADKHHVHNTKPAEKESRHADRAHEYFHAHDNHAVGLRILHRVPDACGFFVTRIEMVQAAKRAANLVDAIQVCFERPGGNEQAVHAVLYRRRLVWEVAAHGIEGNENFSGVETVVTRVLLLGLHDANDHVRNAVHPDRLAHGLPLGEELLLRVAAEKRHVARLGIVFIVVESSLRRSHAANV